MLSYLWLPFMVLPIYAGLERLPDSLLEASGDLGAKAGRTFRSVVAPLAFPAVVAGAIFTFSLSLGDYIAVQIVGGKSQLLGNLIQGNAGAANNLPLAAALAAVPIVIMVVFLLAGPPHRRPGQPVIRRDDSRPEVRAPGWRPSWCSAWRSSTCRCWSC